MSAAISILMLSILISVLAAVSWAQNLQLPSNAVEKSEPVSNQGEPVYRVGAGVTAPRAIYAPDPEYSEEARRGLLQGQCVLRVMVGADVRPSDVRVDRSLGMGLDEKSIEAIRAWRFEPARKDGQPVAAQVSVETSFALESKEVPDMLDPLPSTGTESSQLPDKHAARYPLLLEIAYVTGKQATSRYMVHAEGTIRGAMQPQKVLLTCSSKRNCLMLERAKYRGRWLSANEVELTGRSDNKGKWPKAQFSVEPVS